MKERERERKGEERREIFAKVDSEAQTLHKRGTKPQKANSAQKTVESKLCLYASRPRRKREYAESNSKQTQHQNDNPPKQKKQKQDKNSKLTVIFALLSTRIVNSQTRATCNNEVKTKKATEAEAQQKKRMRTGN